MKAVNLSKKVTETINDLILSQNYQIEEQEIKKVLNFCDRLSFLKRSVKNVGEEELSQMQIASFMTMFLQPRFIAYDLSDWTSPDLRDDKNWIQPAVDEICCDTQEFNAICAKIAKRAKINMTTTAVATFIDEVSIENQKLKVSVDGKVPATYNYSYLPTAVVTEWKKIVGEEMYIKSFNEDAFINAFVQQFIGVKSSSSVVE